MQIIIFVTSKEAHFCVEGLVDPLHKPAEHALVEGFGESTDGVLDLLRVASLLDVLVANLDAGLDQCLDEVSGVDTKEMGDLLSIWWHNIGSILYAIPKYRIVGTFRGENFSSMQRLLLARRKKFRGRV